ncbi:fumarylacetoacetate hydrolase family protein [Hydrogenophaga palleronii]|uniref:fumarylacetoacetate hydrolase family protein n=1 Tax=Hydrogenophaga palleronii TaxID=65655 RepID=UPI0008254E36|nr:fumarylacetoacetate hydrolase family protein [Hydrogenophaga palleronii]
MKIASFNDFRIGIVEDGQLFDITSVVPAAFDALPQQRLNWLIAQWAQALPAAQAARASVSPVALASVQLLAATPCPPHVFAAPANYRKHLGELGDRTVTKKGRSAREQGFFLKAPASVVGAGGAIFVPKGSARRFDHESELAVIIGKGGRDIPRAKAMEHVFGYACLLDATMRIEKDTFEEERSMRKSFEGFTPVGPYIVTADEVPDPANLANRLWVNGELRQEANTSEMIVDIPELIELISSVLPLVPGDLIATGTPEGVGPFAAGDTVTIEIEGVGRLSMPVREREHVSPRAY